MSFRKTVSWLLFPFTMWYAVGVWFRNFLFNIGIKRQALTVLMWGMEITLTKTDAPDLDF